MANSLGYTITKVGRTLAGSYPAGSLYFVVQFTNGVVNDFVFPDLLATLASNWSVSTDYYVGQTCILNDVLYACIGTNSVDANSVPICVGESPPNVTYWAVQSSNVIKDFLLQVMTGGAARTIGQGMAASGVDPHITVNPNVGGVPAAAMVLNGTSGTLQW